MIKLELLKFNNKERRHAHSRHSKDRLLHSIYIFGSKTLAALFSFGTFDSFLAGLGRNGVYGGCCSAPMACKLVSQNIL